MKMKPMRDSISDHTLDHVFTASEFGVTAVKALYERRDYILILCLEDEAFASSLKIKEGTHPENGLN
jgi:hypothetical protein